MARRTLIYQPQFDGRNSMEIGSHWVNAMAFRPKHPCNRPGCRKLTTERYCEEHKREYQRQQDEHRGTAHERGYTSTWRKARKRFLALNPLCVICEREGKITEANVVDHIIPHKGDMELFWDEDNWQSLCTRHHNEKTAREDGGYGNRKKV